MVAVQDITAQYWSPQLGAFGEIVTDLADVAQAVRVICTTRLGERPLEPEFGSEIYKWIDAPLDVARVNIPVAIYNSLGRWEPRVIINSVQVDIAPNMAGVVILIDWSLAATPQVSNFDIITTADFQAPDITAQTDRAAVLREYISTLMASSGGTTDTNDFMRKSEYASTKPGTVLAAERLRGNSPDNTEHETSFDNDGRITTT